MIFTLRSSAIPPTAKVIGFHGRERLSTPYGFDVYFTLPVDFFVDDLHDAVGAKAALTIDLDGDPLTPPFRFHGVLASIRLLRAATSAMLFRARLVPQLWQLTLTKHSRIYTKMSPVDVISDVLDEAGIDYELRLQQTYEPEEHITQYKESNLAFISRWMDREGLYYFFEQGDDGELLVITDHKAAHGTLRTAPVRYVPQSSFDASAKQSFDNFTASHNALPASVKVVDYDYARPLLDVSSVVSVSESAVGEIAEYGGRFFSPQDAQRLAKVRAQDLLAKKTVFEATGAATHLAAGYKFVLDEHPIPGFNDEYLITEMEHHGYEASMGPAWGSLVAHKYDDVYRVEATCLSAKVQFRNGQPTPWPRVDGYENAVVDGPAQSIYAQIDDAGRYAVKFKFDEGSNSGGKASTFVRMAQPHGGSQEGFHFPLRKSVEVICSFLGGDPDRPVIVGVVHNSLNPSVVTETNHTQNVVRTGSLNHIVMEDSAGAMFIEAYTPIFASTLFLGFGAWNFNLKTQGRGQIQTTLNLNIDVDQHMNVDVVSFVDWKFHDTHTWLNTLAVDWRFNDKFTWKVANAVDIDWNDVLDLYVKGNAKHTYDANLDVTLTGGNLTEKVTGNTSRHTTGSEKLKVDSGQEVTIASGQKTTISGGQQIAVTGGQTITVASQKTETVTGPSTITVSGPYKITKQASESTTTLGATSEMFVGAKATANIGAFADMTLGAKASLQAGGFVDVTLGAKVGVTAGFMLDITAGAKLYGHFGWEHEIGSGKSKTEPINIHIVPVTINIGAPRIYIQAIELHI